MSSLISCVWRAVFCDVAVKGELYSAVKADVFIPKMGYLSIVINVKAGTGDVHFLCTDLVGCSVEQIVGHGWRGIK